MPLNPTRSSSVPHLRKPSQFDGKLLYFEGKGKGEKPLIFFQSPVRPRWSKSRQRDHESLDPEVFPTHTGPRAGPASFWLFGGGKKKHKLILSFQHPNIWLIGSLLQKERTQNEEIQNQVPEAFLEQTPSWLGLHNGDSLGKIGFYNRNTLVEWDGFHGLGRIRVKHQRATKESLCLWRFTKVSVSLCRSHSDSEALEKQKSSHGPFLRFLLFFPPGGLGVEIITFI